jgi:hypothetical protein
MIIENCVLFWYLPRKGHGEGRDIWERMKKATRMPTILIPEVVSQRRVVLRCLVMNLTTLFDSRMGSESSFQEGVRTIRLYPFSG